MENTEAFSKIFKALGDSKRMRILDLLSCGERCACMLLEKIDTSQSTLSHHMKLLCESGLVTCRNEGKWTYYAINQETMKEAVHFLEMLSAPGDDCACESMTGCCEGGENNE